jgi:hypothetical protein
MNIETINALEKAMKNGNILKKQMMLRNYLN